MVDTPARDNIHMDIVDGAAWDISGGGIQRATRKAIVYGLIPTGDDSVMFQATQIVTSNLAAENNGNYLSHPSITNMFWKTTTTKMLDPTTCELILTYESPNFTENTPPPPGSNATVSGSVSLEGVSTMKDRQGTQITLSHDNRVQGGEIQVQIPRREVTFTRVEQMTDPGSVAAFYVGTVNATPWNGAAETWLCANVQFDLLDGTTPLPSWNFSYSFRHNVDGWKYTVAYIDPETGKPPPNLVAGTGIKDITWYPTADFWELNF